MIGRRFPLDRVWLAGSALGLFVGIAFAAAGWETAADVAWLTGTAFGAIPLVVGVTRSIARREPGVDVIAVLAIGGSIALGEYLAGSVIAVMLTTGQSLESFAERRAGRELSALLERAPQQVSRYEDGSLVVRSIDDVRVGDLLMVKTGEVVPVDGVAVTPAVTDESALTGEARPVERSAGERVRSGALNAGAAFDLHATALAADSTYAGIVRLVEEAEQQKAPAVRLADRYALWFIPITLVLAGAAWAVSGDPMRALSVLVVATPCPLILAVPIAIVAGISRAARRGVIVKGGGALETLGRADVLLLDKTGTLTAGSPEVIDVETFGDLEAGEVLRLAASLDQVSPHVLAEAIGRAARVRGVSLTFPDDVEERYGAGISGLVDGHQVRLGKADHVAAGVELPKRARDVRRRAMLDGTSCVFIGVDGAVAGAIVIDDPIRPDSPRVIRTLRRAGFRRVIMVTGDHPDVAESVGAALGVDRIMSERTPAEKVEAVAAEREHGVVVMIGDGLNDAPALAAADVGIAMGARGATASSEAADVVLVVDRLDRFVDARAIAARTRRIAIQSVALGMGLALVFMVFGAFGLFGPVAGAVIQEFIDVAAILNALRALRGGRRRTPVHPEASAAAERFLREHRAFAPELARIRETADRLGQADAAQMTAELEAVRVFLADVLPRHEDEEEALVYPLVAGLVGGEDPLSSMSRAHVEIAHLTRVFQRLLGDLPSEGPGPEDLMDLRRVLYGLHAILRLHFAQEEEAYAWLSAPESASAA